ncbi:hypothetical protein Droror1_Dr00016533 [Drosera rotundifolia]
MQDINAMGSLYAAVLFIGVTNGTVVQPVISAEGFVSYRERAAGLYSALPFAFAQNYNEAFKNYETGNQRRIQCLKYLVLANMLMESKVNPFDGQEAKPYKNDPEILATTGFLCGYILATTTCCLCTVATYV